MPSSVAASANTKRTGGDAGQEAMWFKMHRAEEIGLVYVVGEIMWVVLHLNRNETDVVRRHRGLENG